jgi:pyruvate/2-oxoglutarate dehydrogenase complex dihydrolipoamide acyltransferase (E2) component
VKSEQRRSGCASAADALLDERAGDAAAAEVGIDSDQADFGPRSEVGQIAVRLMMNLSSSFDHRFVDGYDCASMIQALKDLLEQPATIFID